MSVDATLVAAYEATTYRVDHPAGPIELRIGEHSPALDALLAEHEAHCAVFITAWNPGSEPLEPQENILRTLALLEIVQHTGWPLLHGEGCSDHDDWPPESSHLVIGLERETAEMLGNRFGQNAIVWLESGQPAELLFLR